MNSKNQPIVELVKDVHWERPSNEFDEFKHYKDMCLVRVRNGQGRFVDGGNRIFWDIDGTPREAPAFQRNLDFFDSSSAGASPHYLYPSKWPSAYAAPSEKETDPGLFDEEADKPRAVAYALSNSLALLLDGHFKTIGHMEYSELVAWMLYPHANLFFSEVMSFLSDNAAKLANYDASATLAIYGRK